MGREVLRATHLEQSYTNLTTDFFDKCQERFKMILGGYVPSAVVGSVDLPSGRLVSYQDYIEERFQFCIHFGYKFSGIAFWTGKIPDRLRLEFTEGEEPSIDNMVAKVVAAKEEFNRRNPMFCKTKTQQFWFDLERTHVRLMAAAEQEETPELVETSK